MVKCGVQILKKRGANLQATLRKWDPDFSKWLAASGFLNILAHFFPLVKAGSKNVSPQAGTQMGQILPQETWGYRALGDLF